MIEESFLLRGTTGIDGDKAVSSSVDKKSDSCTMPLSPPVRKLLYSGHERALAFSSQSSDPWRREDVVMRCRSCR